MDELGHCQDYLVRFSEYIDHELAPDLCARLEEHLRGCSNCTIIFNTLQRTIELYQSTHDETLPESVRSRLFARLSLDEFEK